MTKHFYKVFLLITLLYTSNIASQNNAPSPEVDYDTADIGGIVSVNAPGVLVNDTDSDNDTLTITSFSVQGTTVAAGDSITFSDGVITINADGSYIFEPTVSVQTTNVDLISYNVTDGTDTVTSFLIFSVEQTTNLIEIENISSCNQGYTSEGFYSIVYQLNIRNTSTARDYHENSLIRNIDLINELNNSFGNGCVNNISDVDITTNQAADFVNNPYPQDYTDAAVNSDYLDASSNQLFNDDAINNFILYPRQSISVAICIHIDPLCNGRDGSSIDFENIFNITSNRGNDSNSLEITDFHTTEANVTASLFISDSSPEINPNATYEYTNTVIITNDGSGTANDVNYNMGLGDFVTAGVVFDAITIDQVSGPTVSINNNFNGISDTKLLANTNPLPPGETIILNVTFFTDPVSFRGSVSFRQMGFSQSAGAADGTDETANDNLLSYVSWSDGKGDHVDRYYEASNATDSTPSTAQCTCIFVGMSFDYSISSSTEKTITNTVTAPNGILEQEEITFQLTIENTSTAIQLENLQLTDNLSSICSIDNIISITTAPFIESSSASIAPNLNTAYNGIGNNTIFDGTSGVLLPDESITIQFTVLFYEDCESQNTASFTFADPLGQSYTGSSDSVGINAFTDTDGDGIYNSIDIDDDNDTIPDTDEYNGLDPLGDADNDFIPNYRDTDNGSDSNNDGIIDIYDFDSDGVPNHFDIDSDNDGIFDLVEVNNQNTSQDNDGIASLTNVGVNGLHNNVENSDSVFTTINYTIPNSDTDALYNFIDIDADNDGIVDNIEAQTTTNYIAPTSIVNNLGLDNAYTSGITPIDTEGDNIDDYIDTNSDNDLWNDAIEGWDFDSDGTADTIFSNSDTDNDGLDNAYDLDNINFNSSNNQTPNSFPDVDNPDNPEKDWREIIAISIIMNNISVIEGNNLEFPIDIIRKFNGDPIQSTTDILIDFNTVDGTENAEEFNIAYAPFDYTAASSDSFTITAFTESATYTISSYDDVIYELNEYFTLNGSVISDNTYTTEISGTGTIEDNEAPPTISMDTSSAEEGNDLIHTITVSHPSSTPIIINVSTSDDQAISPDDYTATSESLEIEGTIDENDSNTQVSFTIPTLTDNTNELDEEILNVIGTVSTNNVGTKDLTKFGIIIDIDPDPLVAINDAEVIEGDNLSFTISLLNANNELMFNYLPIVVRLETENGTARATEDYKSLIASVTIPALTSSVERNVRTFDDNLNEDTEFLTLNSEIRSTGVANLNNIIVSTGTIKDNDIPNLFTPNDDGMSDEFSIGGMNEFPNFKIKIFDRWGSEVYNYSNEGRTNPIWWNGTYEGLPVPEGVYYYTLEYNDGETSPKTNFIQLSR